MENKEFIFIQNMKSEINSMLSQKQNEILHKVKSLTKIKFSLVEEEISFMFCDKTKGNIIYYDTERVKLEGEAELIKHSLFILDNELRTLYFIKNTFSERVDKSLETKGMI